MTPRSTRSLLAPRFLYPCPREGERPGQALTNPDPNCEHHAFLSKGYLQQPSCHSTNPRSRHSQRKVAEGLGWRMLSCELSLHIFTALAVPALEYPTSSWH